MRGQMSVFVVAALSAAVGIGTGEWVRNILADNPNPLSQSGLQNREESDLANFGGPRHPGGPFAAGGFNDDFVLHLLLGDAPPPPAVPPGLTFAPVPGHPGVPMGLQPVGFGPHPLPPPALFEPSGPPPGLGPGPMANLAERERNRHGLEGRLGRYLVLKSEINFTSDQRDEFRATIKRNANLTKNGRDGVRKAAEALRASVLAERSDADSVRKAASALAIALGEASVADLNLRQQLLDVLTDEQRTRISSVIKENKRASDSADGSPTKNDG